MVVGPIPVKPIKTVTPPAQINARYESAELTIRNKPAEITTDWSHVWEERGVRTPHTLTQECNERTQNHYVEDIIAKARDGDRIGDLRNEGAGVFGEVVFDRYKRKNDVEVTLVAVPKFGLHFDVKVHPPEIKVDIKVLK